MNWVETVSEKDLAQKGRALFRNGRKQIALFKVDDGLFAIDNRCPHEGYPLKEGTVEKGNCVLTCQWHNWKFDLKTGRCLLGEDHVRTYPTKVESGRVWVELSEPDPEEVKAKILAGLTTAFEKRQYGRIAREISRLVVEGHDPMEGLRNLFRQAHDKLERGMTHAYPAAADWLAYAAETKDDAEKQVACLTEIVDHLSLDVLREETYPYAQDAQTFSGEAFLQAIEGEDEEAAVRLIRGALEAGLGWSHLEYWFTKAALSHYSNFGHSLIYVTKIKGLLDFLGADMLLWLLLPLIRVFCYGTKEDLLPEFRAYEGFAREAGLVFGSNQSPPDSGGVFGKNLKTALAWVREQVPSMAPEAIYETLLEANAKNLLYYDTRYQSAFDGPVVQNVGWLSFTHGITFGNAVRIQCQKFPEFWYQGLLQMACFSARNKPYMDQTQDPNPYQVEHADLFFSQALEQILDHGLAEPIFSCHLLKTAMAAREEAKIVSGSCREALLASMNRFLNSPIKQKHVRRTARQSLALANR